MKYFATILIFSIVLTGCMDSSSNFYGEPVDETAFLEENAQREGVIVTESGLQYRIINEGEGEIPDDNKVVFIAYDGRLINDEVFTETVDLDYFLLTDDVLPGIYEGLKLMREGSEFEFVIPPELGYGDRPPQGSSIRPGSVLIFNITLDSFLRDPEQFLETNAERDDITVTSTGLQYRTISEGSGAKPTATSDVEIRYKGTFTNGYVFDRTKNNDTVPISLSGVIPGFREGVQLMEVGAKYEFFLPSNLGYGDTPPAAIPLGAVLVFEVELVRIN